jgi:uncharacterized membrane protein
MNIGEEAYKPHKSFQHSREKLMVSKQTLNVLLASAVALTVAGAGTAHAQNEKEKCYGVVKAGQNDCAAAGGSHACAGSAPSDRLGDEWVAVPKGLCDKLAGGSVTPIAPLLQQRLSKAPAHKKCLPGEPVESQPAAVLRLMMATRINHESTLNKFPPASLPEQPVGIGLRYPYYKDALETELELGWLEVHPENYFGGGAHRHFLTEARKKYPAQLAWCGPVSRIDRTRQRNASTEF